MTKHTIGPRKTAPLLAITVVLGLLAACTQPDTTKPTVTLDVANSVTTAGALALTATASDNLAVTKVEFYRGDAKIAEDTTKPYEASINISSADNGKLSLSAKAYDAAGNVGVSAVKETTVSILLVKPSKDVLLPVNLTQAFLASEPVTWSVTEASGGMITAAGVYTAPAIAGDYTIHATSVATNGFVDTKIKVIAPIISDPSTVSLDVLKTGGYSIFFRHFDANIGNDMSGSMVPMWWKSCDSTLARQLNDQGIERARATGATIKRLNIGVDRFITSELCRSAKSAVYVNEALGLAADKLQQNAVLNCCGALGSDVAAIGQLITTMPQAGKNIVFVGHMTTTRFLDVLNWSDAVILQPIGDGQVRFIGYIRVADWIKTQ
jgi:phosphohistidine phosphatase SixA